MKNILILGGAGFIGSQLADKFSQSGHVTIIDGLVSGTGGRAENVPSTDNVVFIEKRVEDVSDLSNLLSRQDVIIDSMGWTSHLGAISNPLRDLKLNLHSHLHVLDCLKNSFKKQGLVIYLGSSGQYGSSEFDLVSEFSQMSPIDIQGINKTSAENYYRVYSSLYDINVVSLRIPNCYGYRQPFSENDIGLIGGFIRSALLNKNIEVYGSERKRNAIYVKDLVNIVHSLTLKDHRSFEAYNVPCHYILIKEIAEIISSIVGQCSVSYRDVPKEISKIDTSSYKIDFAKISNIVPQYEMHSLKYSLEHTVQYFKDNIR